MARLLVQLKLRLLRNALNSSTAARVSFLFSSYGALIVAIGVFWILSLLRGSSVSVDLTSIIFTGFAVGWLVIRFPSRLPSPLLSHNLVRTR